MDTKQNYIPVLTKARRLLAPCHPHGPKDSYDGAGPTSLTATE